MENKTYVFPKDFSRKAWLELLLKMASITPWGMLSSSTKLLLKRLKKEIEILENSGKRRKTTYKTIRKNCAKRNRW